MVAVSFIPRMTLPIPSRKVSSLARVQVRRNKCNSAGTSQTTIIYDRHYLSWQLIERVDCTVLAFCQNYLAKNWWGEGGGTIILQHTHNTDTCTLLYKYAGIYTINETNQHLQN